MFLNPSLHLIHFSEKQIQMNLHVIYLSMNVVFLPGINANIYDVWIIYFNIQGLNEDLETIKVLRHLGLCLKISFSILESSMNC
jgi:hypothetical protein